MRLLHNRSALDNCLSLPYLLKTERSVGKSEVAVARQRGKHAERTEESIAKALEAALQLFSHQGYGATSMRQISSHCDMSVGNLYHHFGAKETIYQKLLDAYWERLLDPELELNKIFDQAHFPDDLEQLAAAVKQVVAANQESIMLIYIDVIEFRGKHIRRFYETMAERFERTYGAALAGRRQRGELGTVDPLVGVMVAVRWLFYFYTIDQCFGVPMHFGMSSEQAVDEFFKILRYGLLPRDGIAERPGIASDRRTD
jgi:AcrR family transcriptional regulator